MEWSEIIASGVTLLGGGTAGAAIQSWVNRRKDASVENRADKQQPVDQAMALNMRFGERLSSVESQLTKCQDHHIECERKVGFLEGRVHELSKGQQQLRSAQGLPPLMSDETGERDRIVAVAILPQSEASKG